MTMIASARRSKVDQDLAHGLIEARRDQDFADASRIDGDEKEPRAVRELRR